MKVQLVDVDPLVPGEGGVPGTGLQAKPALVPRKIDTNGEKSYSGTWTMLFNQPPAWS